VEEKVEKKKKKNIMFKGVAVPLLPSWAKMSKSAGKAINLGIPPITLLATE
jgi:hypothetical protein